MRRQFLLLASMLLLVTSCSIEAGETSLDQAIASVRAKVPGLDRASVRLCEELMMSPDRWAKSYGDVIDFADRAMKELDDSDDPNGMKNALFVAIFDVGVVAVVEDEQAYVSAIMNLATVCTDIVSGEYGK